MPVDAEIHSVEITLEDDPRLIAGAVEAAALYAGAAKSNEAAVSNLRRALREACAEAFGNGPAPAGRIVLRVSKYSDRIEVELRHTGLAGFEKPGGSAPRPSAPAPGTAVVAGVDRVQRETQDGISVTRLTKYLSRPA